MGLVRHELKACIESGNWIFYLGCSALLSLSSSICLS